MVEIKNHMLSLRNMKYKVLPWLRASLTAQLAMKETWLDSWIRKIHWRSYRLPTSVFLGFPCGSAGKESACNAGDLGLIPGLGRSPGEGKGYTFQYSDLENSMESIIHGVPKSRTQLNDFHFPWPEIWDEAEKEIFAESFFFFFKEVSHSNQSATGSNKVTLLLDPEGIPSIGGNEGSLLLHQRQRF